MSEITPETLYCAKHPGTATSLRCNRCEKPICTKCAISTPTGYRCPECVRGQQKLFDTTVWYDYPLAFLISLILAGIGSFLLRLVGGFWLIFIIFLAPAAGVVVAEAVRQRGAPPPFIALMESDGSRDHHRLPANAAGIPVQLKPLGNPAPGVFCDFRDHIGDCPAARNQRPQMRSSETLYAD